MFEHIQSWHIGDCAAKLCALTPKLPWSTGPVVRVVLNINNAFGIGPPIPDLVPVSVASVRILDWPPANDCVLMDLTDRAHCTHHDERLSASLGESWTRATISVDLHLPCLEDGPTWVICFDLESPTFIHSTNLCWTIDLAGTIVPEPGTFPIALPPSDSFMTIIGDQAFLDEFLEILRNSWGVEPMTYMATALLPPSGYPVTCLCIAGRWFTRDQIEANYFKHRHDHFSGHYTIIQASSFIVTEELSRAANVLVFRHGTWCFFQGLE